jgi:hypothetical protein
MRDEIAGIKIQNFLSSFAQSRGTHWLELAQCLLPAAQRQRQTVMVVVG